MEKQNKNDIELPDDNICGTCGGSGEITTMERVYPNEPHLAPIGSEPCPDCQIKEENDYE